MQVHTEGSLFTCLILPGGRLWIGRISSLWLATQDSRPDFSLQRTLPEDGSFLGGGGSVTRSVTVRISAIFSKCFTASGWQSVTRRTGGAMPLGDWIRF